jgi:uncharacterized protein (TIGR03435 family)
MTMAQFADKVPTIAPRYVRTLVLDSSGVSGPWDFTITFSPVPPNLIGGAGGVPPATDAVAASDPDGGTSFFGAVEKQLGIKLEMRTRSMPVLVIDHVEEQPIGN